MGLVIHSSTQPPCVIIIVVTIIIIIVITITITITITELVFSKRNIVTASFSYHRGRQGPLMRTLLGVTNLILGYLVA